MTSSKIKRNNILIQSIYNKYAIEYPDLELEIESNNSFKFLRNTEQGFQIVCFGTMQSNYEDFLFEINELKDNALYVKSEFKYKNVVCFREFEELLSALNSFLGIELEYSDLFIFNKITLKQFENYFYHLVLDGWFLFIPSSIRSNPYKFSKAFFETLTNEECINLLKNHSNDLSKKDYSILLERSLRRNEVEITDSLLDNKIRLHIDSMSEYNLFFKYNNKALIFKYFREDNIKYIELFFKFDRIDLLQEIIKKDKLFLNNKTFSQILVALSIKHNQTKMLRYLINDLNILLVFSYLFEGCTNDYREFINPCITKKETIDILFEDNAYFINFNSQFFHNFTSYIADIYEITGNYDYIKRILNLQKQEVAFEDTVIKVFFRFSAYSSQLTKQLLNDFPLKMNAFSLKEITSSYKSKHLLKYTQNILKHSNTIFIEDDKIIENETLNPDNFKTMKELLTNTYGQKNPIFEIEEDNYSSIYYNSRHYHTLDNIIPEEDMNKVLIEMKEDIKEGLIIHPHNFVLASLYQDYNAIEYMILQKVDFSSKINELIDIIIKDENFYLLELLENNEYFDISYFNFSPSSFKSEAMIEKIKDLNVYFIFLSEKCIFSQAYKKHDLDYLLDRYKYIKRNFKFFKNVISNTMIHYLSRKENDILLNEYKNDQQEYFNSIQNSFETININTFKTS